MTQVKNDIVLVDKMSPVLKQVMRSIDATVAAMGELKTANGPGKMDESWRAARIEIDKANAMIDETTASTKQLQGAQRGVKSGFGGWKASMAGIAASFYTIKSVAAGIGQITGVTDEYTLTRARIDLINDGLQTTDQLQAKIFGAAQSARGSYTDMAASVSKLGMLAGNAFGSNSETIRFSELLGKSFKLSGTSNTEISAGTYQLTQAMAAGKLQGDEFRSIMENAPMLAQAIADYTGKTKGDLREMSSEGLITADIIKGALFSAAEDIESKYATLPMTFADVSTSFKNQVLMGSTETMLQLSQIANSEGFQQFVQVGVGGVKMLADGFGWLTKNVKTVGVVLGIGGSMLISYKVGMQLLTIQTSLATIGSYGFVASLTTQAGATGAVTGATTVATGAVRGLSAAMAANPIGLVVMALGTLVGALTTVSVAYGKSAQAANVATQANMNYIYSLGLTSLPQDAKITAAKDSRTRGTPRQTGRDLYQMRKETQNIAALESGRANMINWVQNASDESLESMIKYAGGKGGGSDQMRQLKAWGLTSKDKGELLTFLQAAKNNRDMANFELPDFGNLLQDGGDIGSVAEIEKINTAVDIADESLKYLVDGITRQYVNKINLSTVQPNVTIQFNGDVNNQGDVDSLLESVEAKIKADFYAGADLAYTG